MAKQQQQTHQQQRMADEFTEKLSPSRIHWAGANNLFNFQPAGISPKEFQDGKNYV